MTRVAVVVACWCGLGLTACERSDQVKQDIETKTERQLERADASLDVAIARAQQKLAEADARLTALRAEAKAEGRELGQDVEGRLDAARAKVQQKTEAAKQATVERSREAVEELEAALAELDAALASHDKT
jgi:uncharacterized protein YicC (UPF0701 family)